MTCHNTLYASCSITSSVKGHVLAIDICILFIIFIHLLALCVINELYLFINIVACEKPEDVEHADTKGGVYSVFGSIITYKCADGYFLVGSVSRKCDLNEDNTVAWIPGTPVCQKKGNTHVLLSHPHRKLALIR